jgi:Zn-dependent peptidase ImmA (M78 family)/transcriptional regulator with XRE-family HTH domain
MVGERIRQVREIMGWTQLELAEVLGVVQSAVAQIESGSYAPSDSALLRLAFKTGFDLRFFRQSNPPAQFPLGTFLYRAQAKVSAKDRAKAHRYAQLIFEFVLRMRDQLKPIPVLLPRSTEGPVVTARIVRAAMGLSPDSPITNVTSAIERLGVVVLELPNELEGLDGFSSWVGINAQLPVMCLIGNKIGYRQRFTMGEELGHLSMHYPYSGTVKEADEEARRFAGELLLPESGFRPDLFTPLTLSSLVPLKRKWKVSYQFMIRRAADLKMISPNQYKYLSMQIATRKWRKEEPGDTAVVQERPKAIRAMVNLLYSDQPKLDQLRQDAMGLPANLIQFLASGAAKTGSVQTLQFPNPQT